MCMYMYMYMYDCANHVLSEEFLVCVLLLGCPHHTAPPLFWTNLSCSLFFLFFPILHKTLSFPSKNITDLSK